MAHSTPADVIFLRHEANTSKKAATIAAELNRSLGPERRFVQAMELSDLLRQLAMAGLKSRHPEYSDDEVVRAMTLQFYGDALTRRK